MQGLKTAHILFLDQKLRDRPPHVLTNRKDTQLFLCRGLDIEKFKTKICGFVQNMLKPSQTRRWSRLKPNCYGWRQQQKNNKTTKQQLGRNRGIPKTQLGFSLDQHFALSL
jgi:hypothetical protein